jgi:hypothetical protein
MFPLRLGGYRTGRGQTARASDARRSGYSLVCAGGWMPPTSCVKFRACTQPPPVRRARCRARLPTNRESGGLMGSVIKKRRKRMAKKKHRKLLKKTRIQRRNKK